MTGPVLAVKNLQKRFGAFVVTDDISLELAAGARHALIGPNGAGKTTLVSLLSGVLRPNAGTVTLSGTDITYEAVAKRVKLGLVRTFQVSSLFRDLTVLENVFLAVCEQRGGSLNLLVPAIRHTALLERANEVIAQLGLADDRHRKIAEIAYGRQRLVEIAIGLILEPKVLLLDEPAAGIPSSEVSYLLKAIERLPANIAILMIEHDMQIVKMFATEVTVLVAGRVLMAGSPHDVMTSDNVRSVYLGQSGEARFAAAGHA